MDVVNEAVDWMYYRVPPEKWTFVNVAIAPSTITITEHGVSVVCLVWINVCVLWRVVLTCSVCILLSLLVHLWSMQVPVVTYNCYWKAYTHSFNLADSLEETVWYVFCKNVRNHCNKTNGNWIIYLNCNERY